MRPQLLAVFLSIIAMSQAAQPQLLIDPVEHRARQHDGPDSERISCWTYRRITHGAALACQKWFPFRKQEKRL